MKAPEEEKPEQEAPTRFDRAAQEWVRDKFGHTPDLGSVTFQNDCACYNSGGWADVDVSYTVNGKEFTQTIDDYGGKFDWTSIIREITDMEI